MRAATATMMTALGPEPDVMEKGRDLEPVLVEALLSELVLALGSVPLVRVPLM